MLENGRIAISGETALVTVTSVETPINNSKGWVGDEALAIAVYCVLKYSGDIDNALIAAVNHNGDSDSTGAITGNIIGAQGGFSGIPAKYTEKLELRDLIIEVADDLWHDCRISEYGSERDPVWEQKYIEMTYGKRP